MLIVHVCSLLILCNLYKKLCIKLVSIKELQRILRLQFIGTFIVFYRMEFHIP